MLERKKYFQILKIVHQTSTKVAKINKEQLKNPDYLLNLQGYNSNGLEITSAR